MNNSPILLTHTAKKQLTHDVYELCYTSDENLSLLPGQFLLCDTLGDGTMKRSYSVSWVEGDKIFFIIKRLENGTGGSRAICDQEIGHKMQVWGPMGNFILRDTDCPKIFIGTGTGFAPLYFMARKHKTQNTKHSGIFFLFGVRELRDIFYQDKLESWRKEGDFDYQICCSREHGFLPPDKGGKGGLMNMERIINGRITNYLRGEIRGEKDTETDTETEWNFLFGNDKRLTINDKQVVEYYICGNPAMVREVRQILAEKGVNKQHIFFEQY